MRGAEAVVRRLPELFLTKGGGSPYGPGHVAGPDNTNDIDEHEAAICRVFGKRLAGTGLLLVKGEQK